MALSKKSSRILETETAQYRWAVSEDSGYSILVVQDSEGTGQKLEVQIRWPDPSVAADTHQQIPPITPGMVADIVKTALTDGWVPRRAVGAPFSRRLEENGALSALATD